ncbi:MAG TPA: hypothetical protein VJ324_10160 [Candidatus Acidoferrum sp.]|nr:hypothetical protein [Candidatus Acidoferrum sp.]
MLSYTLGPFLAFLPKRWRESLPFHASVEWRPAVLLSGILECAVALMALVYWYSYSVTHWAADAVFSAIQNGAEINPNAIGFAGLAVMFLHPLTWLIAYCGVEGMVRLCAAFTDTTLGVLPLFLADKIYLQLARGGNPLSVGTDKFSQSHLASGMRAVRERALMATLPLVPDELHFMREGSDEILEIHSCRVKTEWTPPRVVRHEDRYYRLEACSERTAPRPFVYTLRRLPAGVPGRTVLIYSPEQTPGRVER